MIDVSPALGTDYYAIEELLTDEERGIRDRVRAFCEKEVIPASVSIGIGPSFRLR